MKNQPTLSKKITLAVSTLAIVATISNLAAADDDVRKLTAGERTVLSEGSAWGVITSLNDGSLGLTYQLATPIPGTDTVHVMMLWVRSTDGGRTWIEPTVVADRRGPDGKTFIRRPDGGMIVPEQRNQALGQLPSGRIVCAMGELDYHCDKDGKSEQKNHYGSTFEYARVSYTYSDDLGKTWAPLKELPIGPFGGKHRFKPYIFASPHWQIVTLSDGTALMTLYGSKDPDYDGDLVPEDTTYLAGVIRSTDNGETWGDISTIFTKNHGGTYEETALCLLPEDRLLAHMRTPSHNIVQFVSEDGGRCWTKTGDLTHGRQHPGGAFVLQSGRVMATWGNRQSPFGAGAMLSEDGGKTWDYDHWVSLAWDAENQNCGYANGAQAGDGSIVVTYYEMDPTANDHVGLWGGSKVYTIRLTEEQFLEAAGGEPTDD